MSERRICRVLGQHRSTQRRVPRGPNDEERLTADIVELARRHGRLGYRKIAEMLRSTAGCRVGGDVASPTPHRPGRADFPHPVLHERVSLALA